MKPAFFIILMPVMAIYLKEYKERPLQKLANNFRAYFPTFLLYFQFKKSIFDVKTALFFVFFSLFFNIRRNYSRTSV